MTVHAFNRGDPRLWSVDQFQAFLESRPDHEHWQLVDGLAMMMTPPTRWHQKIAKNLLWLLDRALEANRPDLECYMELGARIPEIDDFSPEPDLLVISRDDEFERHAPRFFLVCEIISPSNSAEMIERKLALYRGHPDNLYCLTVDQDSVHVTLFARDGEAWSKTDLFSLENRLALPAFRFETTLAAIYKGTPLAG